MPTAEQILVGIDGSVHGRAATAWAMAEARSRNCGVLLVHVSQIASDLWLTTPSIRRGLRELTQPIVDHAIAFATGLDPEVSVRGRLMLGNPHRALVSLSAGAALTVVGRQGEGTVAGHLIGSVCRSLMAHAHGPVVAVAPDAPPVIQPLGRVVVAVGDRPSSTRSLEFGMEQARHRGVELVVLHAWQPSRSGGAAPESPGTAVATATRRLAAMVAAYAFLPAGVPIRPVVLAGSPLQVLREFCRPADLVVLGRARHDHPLSPTLGPVLSHALHDLPCSIATVGDAEAVRAPLGSAVAGRAAPEPPPAGLLSY